MSRAPLETASGAACGRCRGLQAGRRACLGSSKRNRHCRDLAVVPWRSGTTQPRRVRKVSAVGRQGNTRQGKRVRPQPEHAHATRTRTHTEPGVACSWVANPVTSCRANRWLAEWRLRLRRIDGGVRNEWAAGDGCTCETCERRQLQHRHNAARAQNVHNAEAGLRAAHEFRRPLATASAIACRPGCPMGRESDGSVGPRSVMRTLRCIARGCRVARRPSRREGLDWLRGTIRSRARASGEAPPGGRRRSVVARPSELEGLSTKPPMAPTPARKPRHSVQA